MGRENRLTLANIQLMPRIGVTPGERRLPQVCQADVTVYGDFTAAASTDELDKAINYSRIHAVVLESSHGREYNLIETLACQIAKDVLRSFPADRVSVRVRKRPSSMADKLDFVEVEVEES